MDLYQLGLAPLVAVKHGLELDYDSDFFISEVNADVLYYVETPDGESGYREAHKDHRYIRKAISMKRIGMDELEDVTLDNKFRKGSEEEPTSFENRDTRKHLDQAEW